MKRAFCLGVLTLVGVILTGGNVDAAEFFGE